MPCKDGSLEVTAATFLDTWGSSENEDTKWDKAELRDEEMGKEVVLPLPNFRMPSTVKPI